MRTSTERRPTQAVILAGGRGSRLAPLTDTLPKPMIRFHGKPFLEYLLTMLYSQGFRRILLLLGYRPKSISDYFGDGSHWGLSIEYSVTSPDNDTGRRLKIAAPQLDPTFLLAYCDNYWPMNFDEMWRQFSASKAQAQITAYSNADKYTRDNLSIDESDWVVNYDKSRTCQNLQGVDIGFVLMHDSVVDGLPDGNVSFEEEAYPRLVAERQLQAYTTEHRYYSVGSHDRLGITEEFLARRPAILLDRDGVLNRNIGKGKYVRSWDDWEWLPGALDALRLLRSAGYKVILISNQAGISRGTITEADLETVHKRMKKETEATGGNIDRIYYCPHGWDDGCLCRKPKPGMLLQAQREFHLDLTLTYFLGDDDRDGQAAAAAGCPWIKVTHRNTLLDITRGLLSGSLSQQESSLCPNAS